MDRNRPWPLVSIQMLPKSTRAHKEICSIAISARWTRNVWQVGVTDDMGLRWYLVSDWALNTVAGFSQPCRGKGLFCYSFTKARLEGDVSCRIKLATCKVTSSGHWVLHKWLQGHRLDLFLMLSWENTTSSVQSVFDQRSSAFLRNTQVAKVKDKCSKFHVRRRSLTGLSSSSLLKLFYSQPNWHCQEFKKLKVYSGFIKYPSV